MQLFVVNGEQCLDIVGWVTEECVAREKACAT